MQGRQQIVGSILDDLTVLVNKGNYVRCSTPDSVDSLITIEGVLGRRGADRRPGNLSPRASALNRVQSMAVLSSLATPETDLPRFACYKRYTMENVTHERRIGHVKTRLCEYVATLRNWKLMTMSQYAEETGLRSLSTP